MTSLFEQVTWTTAKIPATAAFGTADILIGDVGQGSPRLLITAGIHGDEGPWGSWAIHKVLRRIQPHELRGSIRVVPMTNPLALQADTRNAPVDQLDLNRVFPGSPDGSYTEQVAHVLATQALAGVDAVIDLHGGGSWCVNAFVFEMAGGATLAHAFPAPFIVQAPDRTVTLTGYARSLGMTVTAVEMGGRSAFENQWADRIATGLYAALSAMGVIVPDHAPAPPPPAVRVGETHVLRPTMGGIFIPEIGAEQVGTLIEQNTLLGRMVHPATHALLEEFRAPYAPTALMLLRPFMAQLEGGAMTYVVAAPLAN